MRPDPARLARAAGEMPAPGRAIAAGHGARLAGGRAPGEDRLRRIEDLMRDGGIEIGGDHGADAALTEAPGGTGIALRNFFEYAEEHRRRHFGAADAFRQQQLVEAAFGQRGDDLRRQLTIALDLTGFGSEQRCQRAGALDRIARAGRGHVVAWRSQCAASSFNFASASVPPMMTGTP